MSTISIIVPVYNKERSLFRCVDSILAQTYTDFELLLIDDGSTDKSGMICDEYRKQDLRVRVFHQKNSGVSSARNVGLDNAVGKWVTFIDADDWITPNSLGLLLKYSTDLIVGVLRFSDGNLYSKLYCDKEQIINKKCCYSFLCENIDDNIFTSSCGKLYKNKILKENAIRFDETLVFGEDTKFVIDYLLYCHDLVLTNVDFYFYQEPGDFFLKYSSEIAPIILFYDKIMESQNRLGIFSQNRRTFNFTYVLLRNWVRRANEKSIYRIYDFIMRTDIKKQLYVSLDKKVFYFLVKYRCYYILKLYAIFCEKTKQYKSSLLRLK